MTVAGPLRNLLSWWLGSLLLWGLITLGFATQLVFAAGVEWQPALIASGREWAPWGIFSPLVVALALRFPFERQRWFLSLPVHILGCTAVVVASGLISETLGNTDAPLGPPWRRPFGGPPGERENRPPGIREDRAQRPGLRPRGTGQRPDRPGAGQGAGGRGPLLMRARLNVPVYWIVVSVTTAVLHSRRARERERRSLELAASLAQSRLAALRAQLQPHFLFNALNAISTLVHKDPHAADEMIANLSDFLRLTLEHGDAQQLPLARELEFVRRYLAIEQVRFGDRLTIRIDFAPETLVALVPVLILQPLVENALKHGLQPKRGAVSLELTARADSGFLVLTVADDGVGLREDSVEPAGTGIGMANCRSRLHELHGNQATLTLEPRPEGGTFALLRLPFETRSRAVP
jgi:signal transduction histidine kinase